MDDMTRLKLMVSFCIIMLEGLSNIKLRVIIMEESSDSAGNLL